MNMRSVLNVAWTLACEGLDAAGINELRGWVYARPDEKAREEEARKRKARENQSAMADLAGLFSMGG